MRPWTVGIVGVLAILVSFGIGYFWRGQEVDKLRDELVNVKSSMGVEVQTLNNEVEKLRGD